MPIRNRVVLVLVLLGLTAALSLAFLTHAPNRLLSGRPIGLASLLDGPRALALAPALVLIAGPFLRETRATLAALAVAAALLPVCLLWLAGDEAARLADPEAPARRTSFGGAFWVLAVVAWLALADGLGRLRARPGTRVLAAIAAVAPIGLLIASGRFDELSILKEYANRSDVFAGSVLRHLGLVGGALVPALLVGVPLGVLAHRRTGARGPLFGVLNVIQTIPSIALFGLLMAPLSGLASAIPALGTFGVSGIGAAPAIVALVLYSLLPVARSVAAGLDQVPASVLDAASGMGMTQGQRFRQVEVPLALPVFLAGLRITVVQAIGLAAVAALIGAGGLGAIMFQGLNASALDLVLLGVVPIVALAAAADAILRLAAALVERETGA